MDQPELEEIKAELHDPKTDILLVLHREDALKMRKIRKKTDLKAGSRGYHPDKLEEWGLIEVIDRDETYNNERTYDLTDRGREFVNDYLLSGTGEVPEHVENTLEHHEAKIEKLQEQIDTHDTKIGKLRDRVEERSERLENYITAVKNDLGITE